MNLTNAKEVKINNKTVQQIKINDNIVYERIQILLSASNSFVYNGGTVLINLLCEKLKNTRIDLYQVIGLTKTKIDTLTTDENGQASYVYTGTGAGEVGFIAEYDGKESNKITVDDYVPEATNIGLISSSSSVSYGTSITLTATVTDQHNQAISGQTVTFKEGNTNIGTGTTNSNGIATLSISLNAGAHTIKAVCGTANSSNITVNVNKLNTGLTIEVPALVYSDVFNVTGVLKDNNDNPISGATVMLKWTVNGQEYSTTTTTNNNGEVTFAKEAPTSITNYTFKLEFDGNTNYNASASSVIQRTVGKETSVLAISSPASPASVSGSSFIMTGTLFDNDGEALEDAEITVEEYVASIPATVTIATAQVDENGDWSCEVPTNYMSDGDNTITVQYDGNIVYTSAVQSFTVRKVSFDGITLSSDKSILSAADSEYATLTAQLTYNDVPVSVSGETVTFEVRKQSDDSLVETLTADTNSSGIATVSYLGKGTGDLYIQAFSGSVISDKIYVEDCFGYAPTEQYHNGYDKHFKILGDCNFPNDVDWELTADLKTSRGLIIASPNSNAESMSLTQLDKYCGIGQNTVNNLLSALGFTNDIENIIWYTSGTYGSNYRSVKITKVDNTYSFYFDGNLHTTTTSQGFTAYTPLYPYIRIAGSGNAYVKNLKIKPL